MIIQCISLFYDTCIISSYIVTAYIRFERLGQDPDPPSAAYFLTALFPCAGRLQIKPGQFFDGKN